MGLDPVFLAVAVPAVLIAGISKGGFAGSAAFVAAPLMATVIEPGLALGIMLPLLMVMDAASLRAYWGRWSGRDVRRLTLGALPGLALAAAIYRLADPDAFRLLIGVIALGFVAFRVATARAWIAPRRVPMPAAAGCAIGTSVGFTSFVAHAGGPATVIYLLSQGLGKLAFQATTVAIFALVNAIKAVVYAGIGIFSTQSLATSLMLAPVAVLGAVIGVHANRVVPERVFFAVTYTLLTVTGARLVWVALT